MNKRAPVYRVCVVTREKLLKEDLYRVMKDKSGIHFDLYQNMPGRGVYIKKDLQVILKGQKTKALSRALKCEVGDEIYLSLIKALKTERR